MGYCSGRRGCAEVFDITKISVGPLHRLALKRDGTVWVWGTSNLYGELGTGKKADSSRPILSLLESIELVPVQLSTISDAIDIGTENAFSISSYALKRNGDFLRWGSPGFKKDGSLGAEDFLLVPTHVCNVPGLAKIYSSEVTLSFVPYVLNEDGTVWRTFADGCVQF